MDIVGILTDTTASIPVALVKTLGIEMIPYHIVRGQADFRDMVEVDPDSFAEYLEAVQTPPDTRCPSPTDYLDALTKLAGHTQRIVVLTMTSRCSGAFLSCQTAIGLLRERMPGVTVDVVDTLQVAMAQGWAAVEAARAALDGLGQKEVVARAREVARRCLTIETTDSLRFLYQDGRISRLQHWLGTLLKVKPIVIIEKGTIVAVGIARNRETAYAQMVELACRRIGSGARVKIAFTHVAARAQVDELSRQFQRRFDCVEIVTTSLSPAMALHSGPGTVGVNLYPV